MKINDQAYLNGPSAHFPEKRVFYIRLIKSIAVMALGFIIEKFTIPIIQATSLSARELTLISAKTYAGDFGILLVAIGLCSAGYAYYQYCFREKQRRKGGFIPTPLPALFLTAGVLVLGLFLFSELLQGVY